MNNELLLDNIIQSESRDNTFLKRIISFFEKKKRFKNKKISFSNYEKKIDDSKYNIYSTYKYSIGLEKQDDYLITKTINSLIQNYINEDSKKNEGSKAIVTAYLHSIYNNKPCFSHKNIGSFKRFNEFLNYISFNHEEELSELLDKSENKFAHKIFNYMYQVYIEEYIPIKKFEQKNSYVKR